MLADTLLQTAEKAVKAFLVHHGKPYEKTHDIEVLIDFAGELDSNFSTLADAADALTPYATRFRYPNATFAVKPKPGEFNEALNHAQTIYDFVQPAPAGCAAMKRGQPEGTGTERNIPKGNGVKP